MEEKSQPVSLSLEGAYVLHLDRYLKSIFPQYAVHVII